MNQYLRRKIWTLNRSGKFRGYLRTVSGYPVTLTDCIAGQPVSLAVDGNTVQDGTPTPDNPVQIQMCGDRTVNLFDVQNINWNDITSGINASNSIHFENGVIRFVRNTVFYNQCRMLASIQLKPNTTYTMMYDHAVMNYKDGTSITRNTPYFRIYKSSNIDSTFNDTGLNNYYAATSSTILTFTTDETTDFEILFNSAVVSTTRLNTLKSYEVHGFMLIEGAYTAETMPAYEPYGYKVPLTMTGMNLLSNNENDWVSNVGTYKYFTIPVEGTTTLQAKIKEGKSIPEKLYLGYSKNGMDATGDVTWLISNGILNGAPIRTSELKYISIHPKTALLDEIFDSLDIMLIEGAYTSETMPAYEPYREPRTFNIYTPQQLAKVGKTADEVVVDFEKRTAELRKNVGSAAFTGDEDWYTNREPTDTQNYFVSNLTSKKVNEALSSLSSHFVSTTANILALNEAKVQSFINGTAWYGACVDSAVYPDIASFKQFVTEQYSKGNPLTVYHAIEPVTTDITSLQQWDAMPSLWSGTAEITADTVIAPSAITAKYYASKPEEVN